VILMLNGVSSSGKSTLARALQERWPRPLLHLGTDTVIGLLPVRYAGMQPSAREGIEFTNDADERGPVVRVRAGSIWRQLEASFARAVRLLADDGHDVVLDLVLFDRSCVDAWVRALHDHRTYLIGVHCDLPVLEARELARGDRFPNLARAQQAVVHAHRRLYDLEVDTTSRAPEELAGAIVAFVGEHPSPRSMSRLHAELLGR